MRILHTSDWHLGQNFFTKSRRNEHQKFIAWLLEQVQENAINVVIIAGDVFDTGAPPSYAREMYNQFVVEMNKVNCELIVLGGNHDSVSTLNESKQLLAHLNARVIANTNDDLSTQLLTLPDSDGAVGAILCAVPFIRPRDVVTSVAGSTGVEKQQALGEAIKQHYYQLYQKALELRKELNVEAPIIATGHLTALGVKQSDSVRDIYIGTLDGFAADGFPPADYIALGHIHRPQLVAKSEHIRYSGSPIPLSFDELKSQKQVVMVEFDKQDVIQITPINVPMFQQMKALKGDLDTIEKELAQFKECEETTWLCIEVEVQDYLSDLQQRIQALTQDLNVEVLQLRRARNRSEQTLAQEKTETLAELMPFDVFTKRIEQETFETEKEQQRAERMTVKFQQILSEVEHKDTDPQEGDA
ncbi:exonuclease subunit SbcD [Aliivibrio fischeri]|uniref:exonuclease subunit SbcD n=1 Tax=Aliivibrio fischeri TaxID=668 RepID=UPI0012DA353A|nr:exonuclease subunit SbcD [Aliivibrio fischeri]MUJ37947.1 exonuclease subunit SbcD [Aliivibrio fischeri]